MKHIFCAVMVMGVAGCVSIDPVPVIPFQDQDHWILLENLTYQVDGYDIGIAVPAGFVTDYASVPKPLLSLISRQGRHGSPSIIHDYLYWTQSCTRLQADNIFFIAMKANGVKYSTAWAIYHTVRGAGQSSWNDNAGEYKAGLPRIVPKGREKLKSTDTWAALRLTLSKEGIRDDMPDKNQPYCSLGDSTEVPEKFDYTFTSADQHHK